MVTNYFTLMRLGMMDLQSCDVRFPATAEMTDWDLGTRKEV